MLYILIEKGSCLIENINSQAQLKGFPEASIDGKKYDTGWNLSVSV